MNIVNVGCQAANYYAIDIKRGKLLVDCGWPGTLPQFSAELKRKGISVQEIKYLLVTHFHPDHAGMTQELKSLGVRHLLLDVQLDFIFQMTEFFKTKNFPYVQISTNDSVNLRLRESRKFLAGIGLQGEVIHTPGHSDDSVTLILDEGFAFTGGLHPAFALPEEDTVSRTSWDKIHQHKIKTYFQHTENKQGATMTDFLNEAKALFPYTQTLRRDFHMHPELGFKEIRTGGIVAKELEALGLEVTKGVGKTGVVGLLEGAKPGPTLLLRFDMDALPISEDTGTEYASQNQGVMHACGHDGHTSIGLTVAKILNAHKNDLAGTVKFCFQPSEEGSNGEEIGGAEMMMKDGVLENPKVDMTLSLHLWNEKPLGWIHVAKGPVMAGAEEFKITIIGKGGHGAIPNTTVDPVVCAAQIISASQTIVSRNVGPLETAVVSFTIVNGGTAFNVIPQEVTMEGTIRTFDPQVRNKVVNRFEDIVKGVASAMGCQVEMNVKQLTPALINADHVTAKVQETARRILPGSSHDNTPYLTMGAEDMAYMQAKVDGCYFFIGSNNTEKHLDYGHHHPRFDFDEQALISGAALMAAAAADILK